jgi:RNA polymerase sigma factor (sigma-70 family)
VARDRFQRLLAAARTGDEGAWAEIFGELSPAVLGYLRGSAVADPENVLGDTFLQVARDVAEFEGDWGGFKAWVFTIAHHRLIDARRSAGRRPADLVAEVPEPETEPMPDAAEQAMERIGTEQVHEVLAVLSKDQRAVVLLRIIGDLSIEQCADALGKRPGAVKQLQRRGLAAVRKQLQRGGVTQ